MELTALEPLTVSNSDAKCCLLSFQRIKFIGYIKRKSFPSPAIEETEVTCVERYATLLGKKSPIWRGNNQKHRRRGRQDGSRVLFLQI
jgi:hypothetical protein